MAPKVSETRPQEDQTPKSPLALIKFVHTSIWAFFVACIIAIPVAGREKRFDWALALTAIVLLECVIILLNRGRCPLTDMAARFTDNRADNFDIYLPLWLARHNKAIFGSLFIAGELFVLWCWLKR